MALADPSPRRRWQAADALRAAPEAPRTIRALVQALGDPEPIVRWEAGQSLVAIDTDQAVQALVDALSDPQPTRRAAAAEALGWSRWPEAESWLLPCLADPDPGVRVAVALALGRVGTIETVNVMIQRLAAEESPGVRWAMLRALGMIGNPAAVSAISERLRDPQELLPVKQNAIWALCEIGWHEEVIEHLLAVLEDLPAQAQVTAVEGLANMAERAVRSGEAPPASLEHVQQALERIAYHDDVAAEELARAAAAQALDRIRAIGREKRLWRKR